MMCRYKGDGGKAVAYLDLQIHLESREPPGDEGTGSSHFAAVESSFDIVCEVSAGIFMYFYLYLVLSNL